MFLEFLSGRLTFFKIMTPIWFLSLSIIFGFYFIYDPWECITKKDWLNMAFYVNSFFSFLYIVGTLIAKRIYEDETKNPESFVYKIPIEKEEINQVVFTIFSIIFYFELVLGLWTVINVPVPFPEFIIVFFMIIGIWNFGGCKTFYDKMMRVDIEDL